MNVFVLSRNVRTCARMHCDRHVVKMPLESAQLLSTALWTADPANWTELHDAGLAYRPTHAGHPCALWTRECINNYLWLAALGIELCREYTYRYGDRPRHGESADAPRQHGCLPVLQALAAAGPLLPRKRCITPFALAMPPECAAAAADPVSSYRRYYIEHKSAICRWTRRDPPEWYLAGLAARGISNRFSNR